MPTASDLLVFIVEDNPDYAALLRYQVRKQPETRVQTFESGEAAHDHLSEHPDLVLLDLNLPGQGGLATLRQFHAEHPGLPVVIVSGQQDVEAALEAIRLGARDYITKGQDDVVKVEALVRQQAEQQALRREVEALRQQFGARHRLDAILGESAAMAEVFRLIHKSLRGDLTVAILGESGTGKELVAQAIHANSARRQGPFVVVNCAAIPRELMESEFFGHERGAFTGATSRHIGTFEQADRGTLFLDEVGELELGLQAKLLRALQNREIQRVGGREQIRFDARILCATNRDPQQMVQDGTLREDLYYRLFQFPIALPPLRARGHDVLLLADAFHETFLAAHPDVEARPFAPATRRALLAHPWPGNVRELKHAVERALMVSDTPELQPADLMLHGRSVAPTAGPAAPDRADDILPLTEVKRQAVQHAVTLCNGNIEHAARRLGIARSTVYRILDG